MSAPAFEEGRNYIYGQNLSFSSSAKFLPHLPLVEYADFVRHAPHGGEAVRDYQGRPPLGDPLECRLHQVFALAIQGAKIA